MRCNSFKCRSELIGARSGLVAASDSLETRDNVGRTLALDKGGDALEIAVAAADKVYVGYDAVLNFDLNNAGACAGGLILIFHNR